MRPVCRGRVKSRLRRTLNRRHLRLVRSVRLSPFGRIVTCKGKSLVMCADMRWTTMARRKKSSSNGRMAKKASTAKATPAGSASTSLGQDLSMDYLYCTASEQMLKLLSLRAKKRRMRLHSYIRQQLSLHGLGELMRLNTPTGRRSTDAAVSSSPTTMSRGKKRANI